jgi:hypothetical protein
VTTRLTADLSCPRCRTVGTVFWSESGWRDQDERVTAVWGEFAARRHGQEFEVSCRRCGSPVERRDSRRPELERARWCRG